jgi:hypothetical protein
VQKQASTVLDQVMRAVGAATNNVFQSAAAALQLVLCRIDDRRHKGRPLGRLRRLSASVATPTEQLLRRNAMSARNLENDDTRRQRRSYRPRFSSFDHRPAAALGSSATSSLDTSRYPNQEMRLDDRAGVEAGPKVRR